MSNQDDVAGLVAEGSRRGRSGKSHPGYRHGNCVGNKVTREFKSWSCMHERCENPRNQKFPRYGGRGIRVCERWSLFENFLADMGCRPPGTTLDRVDNDGDYEPSNCRWATYIEQAANSSNANLITVDGVSLPQSEWSRRLGLSSGAVSMRIARGWSPADAVSNKKYGKRGQR